MTIQNRPITSLNQALSTQQKTIQRTQESSGDFAALLDQKLGGTTEVKMSKHAAQRLQERNIELTDAQKQELGSLVDKADRKGIRESLVVMDNAAFVVHVPNRTVITAVTRDELKENVFTHIDGAVFSG